MPGKAVVNANAVATCEISSFLLSKDNNACSSVRKYMCRYDLLHMIFVSMALFLPTLLLSESPSLNAKGRIIKVISACCKYYSARKSILFVVILKIMA